MKELPKKKLKTYLECHGLQKHQEHTQWKFGLVGAMRPESVGSSGDADTGEDVQDDGCRESN